MKLSTPSHEGASQSTAGDPAKPGNAPTELPEQISCMEVWGGNEPTRHAVSLAGLDGWVYCLPYNEAEGGGDVYFISSCATGRIARLLVADVSGHGSAVAELGGRLRKLMRRYVNHLHQTRFVQAMNAQFSHLSNDGVFATALVTTFFGPTGELSICNAGHPPPLRYRATEKKWESLEEVPEEPRSTQARNLPLGILDIVDYEQFSVTLESGDLVLCYTDSLIEARDSSGELLQPSGLLNILASLDINPAETLVDRLLARIDSRAAGRPWDDDVTAMLFRCTGKPPALSMKTRICAPFRALFRLAFPDLSIQNVGGAMFTGLNRAKKR